MHRGKRRWQAVLIRDARGKRWGIERFAVMRKGLPAGRPFFMGSDLETAGAIWHTCTKLDQTSEAGLIRLSGPFN
jgi:hypothetical protein